MKMKNKMIILAVFPALCIAGCFRETDSFAEWEERLEALDAVEERLEAFYAVFPSSLILAELSFVRRYMEEYVHLLQAVKSGSEFDADSGLGYAILFGDMESAKLFIGKGADVRGFFKDAPMLHLAAWLHRPEMVKLLLENGADVNALDPIAKRPPLIFLIHQTINSGACLFLIPDRVVIDECIDECEITDGRYEAEDRETLKILLRNGANPNGRDTDGTPFIYYFYKDLDALKILVDAGADVNARDTSVSKSLLELADRELLYANNPQEIEYRTRIVEFLLSKGARR